MTRVLVIRFSSMGDVILTSPVVRALHVLLEGDVEVHVLTKAVFSDAVDGLEGVHRVWTMDRTTAEVEQDLVAQGFHYVVDLHANARSAFVKRALRKGEGHALDLTVNKRSLDKILLVRTGVDRLAGQHVVERYLDTLRPFGDALAALKAAGDDGRLQLPVMGRTGEAEVSGQPRQRKVVMALGAAHSGKAIPEDHWRSVLEGVVAAGHRIVLVGGPAESELGERLAQGHPETAVHSIAGKRGWANTFEAIARGDVLIAGDTGAMHAGAALGVPMVVVWGCTSPALGMGPWRAHPDTIELEPEDPQRSRPCSRLGDRCRHRTPCIQRVSSERILAAALSLLS